MSRPPEASTKGFTDASAYDTHRPSYPTNALESLLQHLLVKDLRGARLLDLGAGTGKLTEILARRDEGFEITAVEPHDAMREELRKKGLRKVRVLEGAASKIPAEDEIFDAVIAAQVGHDYFNPFEKRLYI